MSTHDAEKESSMFKIDEACDNNLKVSANNDKMSQNNTEKVPISTIHIGDKASNNTDTLSLISTGTLPRINNFNNHFSNTVEESLLAVVESSGI
jgi:hypothetical protein